MSSTPPVLREEAVLSLLESLFPVPIAGLKRSKNNRDSQAFDFACGSLACTIRFRLADHLNGYAKEEHVCQQFAPVRALIPAIVQHGEHAGHCYAVSIKAPGQTLDRLPVVEYEAVFPEVMRALHSIHTTDICTAQGWGLFDEHGVGLSPGWPAYLEAIWSEEHEYDTFDRWHNLYAQDFWERSLFELIYAHLLTLLPFAPAERWLVHGNIGYNNLLVYQGQVTAVLGWEKALYGDFIYDIARLGYFAPGKHIPERFQEFYAQHGVETPHFAERLLGCQFHISLDALRFFAITNNPEMYEWVRARALDWINLGRD